MAYNLRSSTHNNKISNPTYTIEVMKSPTNNATETDSPSRRKFSSSNSTPTRILPKIPPSPINIMLPEKIMVPEYIDRLKTLEIELAKIRIDCINISTENETLKDRVTSLEDEKDELSDNLISIEQELNRLNQYGRRENIELSGIPTNISQDRLENVVIDILRYIGLEDLESYDIAGCHRIHKSNVIVRFVNRKHAIQSLKYKKYLKGCRREFRFKQNVFMYENLCPAFRSIEEKCRNLMDNELINQLWSYNGIIHFKYTNEKTEKPKKILHENQFNNLFPEFNNLYMT